MTHVLVTPERAAILRERLKKLFAERQAAQEKIDRIADGAPRSAFGDFAPSFEEVLPRPNPSDNEGHSDP